MAVCINCHIALRPDYQRNEYHAVDFSGDIVSIIEEWYGREISDNDRLCQECVTLVIQEANNRIEDPNCVSGRQLGHVCVCVSCGVSLSKRTGRRRYRLPEYSVERIYLESQIFPRQIPIEAWACNACWTRSHQHVYRSQPVAQVTTAERAELETPADDHTDHPNDLTLESSRPSSSVSVASSETNSWADQVPNSRNLRSPRDTIRLNNYTRTPDSPNKCFVPDCVNTERLRIPRYLRRSILDQHKIYVTQSARVCREHSMLFNWDILNKYEFLPNFSAAQIENMLNLFKK